MAHFIGASAHAAIDFNSCRSAVTFCSATLGRRTRQTGGVTVYPEIRVYADPFEQLTVRLTGLRGLVKLVLPLIEADRQRRWEDISARPSDGNTAM
jgi:hypothetical protein